MSKTSDADEVFEFLDSLPSKKDGGASTTEAKNAGKKDDDILDFLDELEKSNINKATAKKEPAKEEPIAEQEPVKEQTPAKEEEQAQEQEPREDTPVNDPITSISNWWSSSGSTTVSNLWNRTTEQASHLQKKLAEEQKKLLDEQNIQLSASQLKGITSNISKFTDNLDASKFADLANKLQEIVVGETEEVLRIHLVHDFVNYPLLQYHVEEKFHSILNSQVQGGIRIFVDEWTNPQEGKEPADESESDSKKRQLSIFNGKIIDGEKLAFANLDNAIKLFNKSREAITKQQQQSATEDADDSTDPKEEKDLITDIFISIVAVSPPGDNKNDTIKTTDCSSPGNFSFTVVLKDITNNITSITRSQGFPNKWAQWLEGSIETKSAAEAISEAKEKKESSESNETASETEHTEVDQSEWVKEWVEDGLSLTFGTAAQNYIIERMGF
ncbi:hypothetical protein TPHA_0B01180 [Tetrapisispora phaffii CBS 4417]|uniref:Maintenance of telomere capping protein 1 n=1 Tax=Tetrapisispora phaffii (strain ATCC 24235 / CBS 4417 / NBRC 1672 / NRRL Y-8282 / UCD 70-5) TaxID=1071381 RepID=G8BP59_TETPH|nr:hypothetical protein TPHA_0B01180 [Tetrapisispora phaffii CBS 4417]CCE61790.1 hypothetical protein TPHA_0B01180 [Tetrapisispora phaffii CBS 4417]